MEDPGARRAPGAPAPARARPEAARRITVTDVKVEQPLLRQMFLAPSVITAKGRDAFALDILAEIVGGGTTSQLYRDLVLDKEIAVSVGAWYMGSAVDASRFGIYGAPNEGVSLEDFEAAIGACVGGFLARGIGEEEFARAKTRLIAEMLYAQDSQSTLARVYGSALAIGETIEDVRAWPERIEAVTPEASSRRGAPCSIRAAR